ncbi:peptidase M14 [Myxococcota bacterium]|nr:peptidase M14 [Myxococcota bacterium]
MTPLLFALLVSSAPSLGAAGGGAGALVTTFETSGGTRTGRYDEALGLCHGLAKRHPKKARCTTFGTTPEGRPMIALVVSGDGTFEPKLARRRGRTVVLFQGGIHAGEIDGKDAGFLELRGLLDGSIAKVDPSLADVLAKTVLVFVPVFNVDGHERFGRWNRPNQRGPEEMGWRVTAENLNLNRDYVKADAPEMRAMLALLRAWDPEVYVDLHVTDGAKFQHGLAVLVSPRVPEGPLADAAAGLRAAIAKDLDAKGHLPIVDFYPSFEEEDDPASGFAIGEPPPRFSQGYWSTNDRLGVLVETHSWKDYATRVTATRDTLRVIFRSAATDGARWRASITDAERRAAALAGQKVVLTWDNGPHVRTIDFQGYFHSVERSDVTGGKWIRYDESRPQVWRVPLRDELVPKLEVVAPKAGYVVPAVWARIVKERLDAHGVAYATLTKEHPDLEVESFRATKAEPGKATYEGRTRLAIEGKWTRDRRGVGPGALFVPITQPRAKLVLHLFEPTGPDALAAWGFFNGAFEQKEYMEAYVVEEVAREMLAKDAALAAEFWAKVKSDAAFAASPDARRDFFYRRTPSYDERAGLYPIYRVDADPR